MKAHKDHRIPLSGRAIEILEAAKLFNSQWVFPSSGRGGLSGAGMSCVLDRMGRDKITVHGFRSTFRDWAAEMTAYPREVAEMALAHTIRNDVEAAYRRGDLFEKRMRLMAEWARYCDRETAPAEVVGISMQRSAD
jgi:integrase